jgi:hypothetical protein
MYFGLIKVVVAKNYKILPLRTFHRELSTNSVSTANFSCVERLESLVCTFTYY